MKIRYKDIPGEPGYRVGSDGSVWSARNGRWGLRDTWKQLKPGRMKSPAPHYARYIVVLGQGKSHYVHRLVLEAFVGPPLPGQETCHLDSDASNNHLNNLRWDTRAGNMRDMANHGRRKAKSIITPVSRKRSSA